MRVRELHEIESPRGFGSDDHVQPWSDAPNVALSTAYQSPPPQIPAALQQAKSTNAERGSVASSDDEYFKDELSSEESYFRDEIPPD